LKLTAVEGEDTSVVLSWTLNRPIRWFDSFLLVMSEGTAAIKQEWNYHSAAGVPRLDNAAVVIGRIYEPSIRSVKVNELTRSIPIRFMLVFKTTSPEYSYSNEIVLPAL
jgi:hypothetical protein